jgi:hypothetical protein
LNTGSSFKMDSGLEYDIDCGLKLEYRFFELGYGLQLNIVFGEYGLWS